MRTPAAGQQKVDVEQMAHGKSASNALTSFGFIGGAPGGATRTLRPAFSTSLARPGSKGCRINLPGSTVSRTLSPGCKCSALRILFGITNWPLVERVAVLMQESYPSYRLTQA